MPSSGAYTFLIYKLIQLVCVSDTLEHLLDIFHLYLYMFTVKNWTPTVERRFHTSLTKLILLPLLLYLEAAGATKKQAVTGVFCQYLYYTILPPGM
jgi:hypothetical protein